MICKLEKDQSMKPFTVAIMAFLSVLTSCTSLTIRHNSGEMSTVVGRVVVNGVSDFNAAGSLEISNVNTLRKYSPSSTLTGGYMIFKDIPPGTYRVSRIIIPTGTFTFRYFADKDTQASPISFDAGKCHFIGSYNVKFNTLFSKYKFTIDIIDTMSSYDAAFLRTDAKKTGTDPDKTIMTKPFINKRIVLDAQ
jgi:hypothetical protein